MLLASLIQKVSPSMKVGVVHCSCTGNMANGFQRGESNSSLIHYVLRAFYPQQLIYGST
jgi:hypothetical protein